MSTPAWFRSPLTYSSQGPLVALVQRKLGLEVTGVYDDTLAAAIRGLQRARKLEQTGEVDEETATVLGPAAAEALLPEWFERTLALDSEGRDVAAVNRILIGPDDMASFDMLTEMVVRRFQSHHGITPTGIVTEVEARLLGE